MQLLPPKKPISTKAILTFQNLPLVFCDGDKGGTGKSAAARVVSSLICELKIPIAGFDADARNGHLERYCGDSFWMQRESIRENAGYFALCNMFEERDEVIVVDLPGNIGDVLQQKLHHLKEVARLNSRPIVHVWVADEEEDSIILFNLLSSLAPPDRTFFVLNGRFGRRDEFALWNNCDTRKQFLKEGGTELYLPALNIFPRTRIQRARMPFHLAHNLNFPFSELVEFEAWWATVRENFAPLTNCLRSLTHD